MVIVLDNVEHLLDGVEHGQHPPGVARVPDHRYEPRAAAHHGRASRSGPPARRRRRPAVHRASRAVRPGWEPGDDRPVVEDIRRLVDHLPLGIEPRGGRVPLLRPTLIRDRLAARLPLPERPSATPGAPADAGGDVRLSHDLLDEERTASCCMTWQCSTTDSTRPGRSVAEPADGTDRLTDVLELADQNLLMADGRGTGRARFRMLRTIQSFALARLVAGAGGGCPGPARRCLSHGSRPPCPGSGRLATPRPSISSNPTWATPLGASLVDRLGAGSRALEPRRGARAVLARLRPPRGGSPRHRGGAGEPERADERVVRARAAAAAGSIAYWQGDATAARSGMTRRSNSPQRPTTRRASPTRSSTAATCSSWGPGRAGAPGAPRGRIGRYRALGDERGARASWGLGSWTCRWVGMARRASTSGRASSTSTAWTIRSTAP